jgi:hypothetical protein
MLQTGARLVAILSLVLLPVMTLTTPVAAQSAQNEICQGLGSAGGSCGGSDKTIHNTLTSAINILSLVAGVVAVIMIMISGLRIITAQGDASSISSARMALIYSLIGLVIVALAQFIVHFVLSRV